jgi:hypothetical protein
MKLLWLILVAVAFCAGIYLGATISQPILLDSPARNVLKQADELDRALLGGLQDTRNIADDMRKLRDRISKLPEGRGKEIVVDLDIVMAKLTDQNTSFQAKLWQAHESVAKAREQLKLQAEASSGLPVTVYDQVRRFLKWIGPLLLVAMAGLLILLLSPRGREWLARVEEAGLGPLSLKLGDVASVKVGIRESLGKIDEAVSATYQDKCAKFDLEGLFARLKLELDKKLKEKFNVDMAKVPHRATLYVPGMTDEQLVQATKYLSPIEKDARKVVGRRFSVRYGIIGRAFRQRTALYNWKVENSRNQLVRDWGLTRSEAYKQGGEAASLMAFPIPPDVNSDPLGIVYLEAKGENLLMPGETAAELGQEVANDPNGRVKADQLAYERIWKPLWDAQLVQPLYEALEAMKRELTWDTPLVGKDGQ